MPDDVELVTVESTSDRAIAQFVLSILRDAGIPAFVDGALLQDDWAMARKLPGRLSTGVQVPKDRLDEARSALGKARERAGGPGEAGEDLAWTSHDSDFPPSAAGSTPGPAEPEEDGEDELFTWPRGLLLELLVVFLVALLPNLCGVVRPAKLKNAAWRRSRAFAGEPSCNPGP